MPRSFSRSFSVIGASLVLHPTRVLHPTQGRDTCRPVGGIGGPPVAILYEWSDERTLPPCPDKPAFVTSRQRSAYGLSGLNVQAQLLFRVLAVHAELLAENTRLGT